MDPGKLVDLQVQMRRNQEDLTDYLREMESWETEIKLKEEQLVSQKNQTKDPASFPPVRNSLTNKVLKKKKKKQPEPENFQKKQRKIRGNDYRSWDRFDVEKACAEVDEQKSSSSSEYETDEEAEELRKKQLANQLKDEGNQFFKKEEYNAAVEHYSRGLELDTDNVLLLLNRAMALLKQEKFGAAEQDCTKAIVLGTRDTKAWFRRGCAREALKRYEDALKDFEEVLKLDSHNKAALGKIDTIRNILHPAPPSNVIKAIYIPPEKRSKKPLRRILVEEIGVDNDNDSYHMRVKTDQSSDFDRFLAESTSSTEGARHDSNRLISEIKETSNKTQKLEDSNSSKSLKTGQETSGLSSDLLHDTNPLKTLRDESSLYEMKSVGNLDPNLVVSESEQTMLQSMVTNKVLDVKRKPEFALTVPKTSCQFQAQWKVLQKKPYEFFQLFKQIDPKDYHTLFTVAFDDDLLTKILSCLQEFYISENLDVFPVLEQLTKVQRFSTVVMFLSQKYKQVLKDLFLHVDASETLDKTSVRSIEQLYGL